MLPIPRGYVTRVNLCTGTTDSAAFSGSAGAIGACVLAETYAGEFS